MSDNADPINAIPDNQPSDWKDQIQSLIIDYVDSRRWRYQLLTNGVGIQSDFRGKQCGWTMRLEYFPHDQIVSCQCALKILIDPSHYPRVIDLVSRINDGLILGNFDLHLDDGSVVYRTSVNISHFPGLPTEVLRNLVAPNHSMIERFYPAFMAVLFDDVPPIQAVRQVRQAQKTTDTPSPSVPPGSSDTSSTVQVSSLLSSSAFQFTPPPPAEPDPAPQPHEAVEPEITDDTSVFILTALRFLRQVAGEYSNVSRRPDTPEYKFYLRGRHAVYRCYLRIRAQDQRYLFRIVLDERVPRDHFFKTSELMVRINSELRLGSFEMDFHDGEIICKNPTDIEDIPPTVDILNMIVHDTLALADRFFPAFMKIIHTRRSPAEILGMEHDGPGNLATRELADLLVSETMNKIRQQLRTDQLAKTAQQGLDSLTSAAPTTAGSTGGSTTGLTPDLPASPSLDNRTSGDASEDPLDPTPPSD